MRKSSVGLMMVPIAGLAAYGWLARRPAVVRAPGLFIEKAELAPLTAREASQGYTGKALVTLDWAGRKPAWWGNFVPVTAFVNPNFYAAGRYAKGGFPPPGSMMVGGHLDERSNGHRAVVGTINDKSVRVLAPRWQKRFPWSEGRYIYSCYFKLKQLPKSAREVWLKVVGGEEDGVLLQQDLRVRAAGAPTAEPAVSHESQVKIIGAHVSTLPPVRAQWEGDCRVDVDVRYTGSAEPIAWNVDDETHVVDSHGKQWTWFEMDERSSKSFSYFGPPNYPAGRDQKLSWSFHSQRLPRGPLVLKSGIGIGDGWIEPIRIVVRTGKERAPHLRTATTEIVGTMVWSTTATDKINGEDTVVTVSFRSRAGVTGPPGAARAGAKPKWICDYSQHLMDARGMKLWSISCDDAPVWDALRKCWKVDYIFRAAAYPKGKLRFRAKIGQAGEEMVPVECVARK